MTLQAAAVARAGEASEAGRGPDAAGGEGTPVPVLRWFGVVWLAAFVVLLANQPGRMVFDTKLPVDLDPSAYFATLWHLWNPLDSFGTLHNQAIGYAVPMAPAYLAGQLAHVPVWITERLWMSLIIAAGFSGLVKLADALGIGSRSSRLLAGLVFALWPTFTIVIGSTSAAVLPGMLAPWAVLPLVNAVQPGWAGRSGPLWPAARSGAVVLLMGGVNATSTVDVLLLPALFIVTYARGRRLVSLFGAWAAAVAAATAWWLLPLLLQGKYAFNFLPYVEQSATTTGTASAAATLRGAGNWVAYLNFGTPWLPAGWAMVTTPIAIIAAAAAAGCGLYGLSRRRMPAVTWLRLSAGIAAAGALAGYGGPLGGPFHGAVQHLLDGPLAPFRNVYKLEPVIAAALALGVAHATARWLAAAAADSQPDRKALAIASRLVLGFMLVGLAVPYLSGRILNPGSFTAVPRYWYQVAGYLAAHSPRNAALVVPADAHGEYVWGDPIDDPLEALGTSPWVAQGLVPYGGAGSQLVLQTAEKAIESGEQVPGLGAYLQRAGIRYVVVRNDLDPLQVGYTPPGVVHQTLALSGFTRVATFGAAEIYAVDTPALAGTASATSGGGQPPSPVSTFPVSQTMLVNGGPDALLQLAGQHLLGPAQPVVVAGNPLPAAPARWAVTDGLRRADEATGLINSNISYAYTATENNPVDDQLGGAGGPPRQYLPVPAAGHQTVAVLSGAAQVSVSSYGSWLADTQQEDPVSAFDGNPATAWAEGSAATPVGQWIQIAFDHPVDLPASVGIRLLDDNPSREIATRLRVSTAAGTTTTSVAATGKTQPLHVVPGRTSWLRVTIAGAGRVTPGGPGAGISDVLVPGVRVSRLLRPAQDPAGQRAAQVSFSFHQQVPSPVTYADPAGTAPMARTFTVTQPATLRLSASALAVPGSGLDALLDKIPPPGRGILQVSVATASPWAGPASLFRGSQPLIADNADPVIHLSWHGKRRIRSLTVQMAGGSVPQTVEISSPEGTRQAGVGFGGLVTFKRPLTTDRIDVSFPRVQQATTVSSTGQVSVLPVELSRLRLPALAELRVVAPSATTPFSLACGQGPELRIDGQAYPTAVRGTLGELTGFRPVQVRLCTPDGTLALGPGRHTLTAAAPGTFAVTDLSLTGASGGASADGAGGGGGGAAASAAARTITTGRWQPDQRQLAIGPGPASYLEVHQNYNAGWAATLNGHQLVPVDLDGWQQGFVVPAGTGGTITLSFRPAASYHIALVVSMAALAVLLGLVTWSFVFGYGRAARCAGVPGEPGPARYAALGSLGVIALTFAVGGPVALAAVVVVALAWRWPRWLPVLAFSGMAVAGLLTAMAAQPAGTGLFGAFGAPAQACALVALAAALVPALAPARARQRPDAFGVVDELTCYFDSPDEPGNVHVEVWLPGHLDPERLREATTAMLSGQPRARARRAPGNPWRSGYTWEFPPQADHDPVSVASWQAEAELDAARTRFLAAAPPLDLSPPFRLLLARGPGRDALILNAHHAAFDGHSCLRLLRLIADQYSRLQYGQVRHGEVQAQPGPGADGPEVSEKQGRVRPPTGRSVRIAPQHEKAPHENGRGPHRVPGYGFRLLLWPDVPSVPPGPTAGQGGGEGEPRATVNDLLVAALIETVRRWNRGRHQREHAGSCIKISVPLDARPPGGGDELGNLSRLGTVTAEPDSGDGRDLVALVAGQTRRAKDEPGPQVDPALAALARARLPVAVKRRLLRAAIRGLGPLASDTSLLSNLGRVTDPPRFGPLSPERIWFSTSAHMPRGLSAGAITIDGRLQLCFRYRRALLDDAAAADFAATFAAALSHLAASPAKEEGT